MLLEFSCSQAAAKCQVWLCDGVLVVTWTLLVCVSDLTNKHPHILFGALPL